MVDGRDKPDLPHPVCLELRAKMDKLEHLLDTIFKIADQDLIITDANSGSPDLRENFKLGKYLTGFGKTLMALGEQCMETAEAITDTTQQFIEKYQESDKVKFVAEIKNPVLKDAICQLRQPLPVKKTGEYVTWQMKQEAPIIIDSDTEDEDDQQKLIYG